MTENTHGGFSLNVATRFRLVPARPCNGEIISPRGSPEVINRGSTDAAKGVARVAALSHHPYACLFPMLADEQIQELADDIAKHGLRNPIVVDVDEKILDGRNRAAACIIAGVEPVLEPFIGSDEEKLAFVVSANIHRRHLTTSQRAMIADRIRPMYEELAAKRQTRKAKSVVENFPQQNQGKARDQAAAAVGGVSGKAVDMAAKVHAKAVPEIVAAVESGKVAVSAAAAVADLPKTAQKKLAAEGPKAIQKAAAEAREAKASDSKQFSPIVALGRLGRMLRDELEKWPEEHRDEAAGIVRAILEEYGL